MNRTLINQSYYLKNQALLKEKRRLKYQAQKSQSKSSKKSNLGEYYHANNIRVLISLKDYLDSSAERMKLWYRFSSVLNDIKAGVSDIIEIMRLREVMNDLIEDYWTTAKKNIRITKKWNKLTPQQQAFKQKQWAEELKREEQELFNQFEKQQQNQSRKQKTTNHEEKPSKQGKEQCPDCGKYVQELDEENGICSKCLAQYE